MAASLGDKQLAIKVRDGLASFRPRHENWRWFAIELHRRFEALKKERPRPGPAGSGSAAPDAGLANASTVPNVPVTDVQPSSIFQQTDLKIMRIVRPENWDVTQEQQNSVTIAPSPGVSGGAVAYGAVIQAIEAPAGEIRLPMLQLLCIASGDWHMMMMP